MCTLPENHVIRLTCAIMPFFPSLPRFLVFWFIRPILSSCFSFLFFLFGVSSIFFQIKPVCSFYLMLFLLEPVTISNNYGTGTETETGSYMVRYLTILYSPALVLS